MKGHLEEVINFYLLLQEQDEGVFRFISQILTMIDFTCFKDLIGFELKRWTRLLLNAYTVWKCLYLIWYKLNIKSCVNDLKLPVLGNVPKLIYVKCECRKNSQIFTLWFWYSLPSRFWQLRFMVQSEVFFICLPAPTLLFSRPPSHNHQPTYDDQYAVRSFAKVRKKSGKIEATSSLATHELN